MQKLKKEVFSNGGFLPIALDPYFITGFADGESSFMIKVAKNKEYVFNYAILALFQVQIHKKDRGLLELIQAYFKGVGKIYEEGNAVKYVVSSVEEVKIIINHFDKYPLITQKQADLELFKMAFKLILNKEHLTREGIKKIISIRASMNLGLTDSLKIAFPNIIPVLRPTIKSKIPNPYWVTGFTSAEGCFFVRLYKSSEKKFVDLRFEIVQHQRDEELMKQFIAYFGCGFYYARKNKKAGNFIIVKYQDINEKIIPFFQKYPVHGVKFLDFKDFCWVASLMKVKAHLTAEGWRRNTKN